MNRFRADTKFPKTDHPKQKKWIEKYTSGEHEKIILNFHKQSSFTVDSKSSEKLKFMHKKIPLHIIATVLH